MAGKIRMLVMLTVTLAKLYTTVGGNIRENVKSEEILEKMETVSLKTYYSLMAHSGSMFSQFCFVWIFGLFILAALCTLQNFSSLTRDSTQATTVKMLSSKH